MTQTPQPIATPCTDLLTLAHWMAGDFSNQKQAFSNPQQFSHIHVFFRPLPFEFFGGVGFYSEQAHDYDLWNPYRQGVHRLVDQGTQVYIENYALIDPLWFAGAARDLNILKTITHDRIQRRENCAMIFHRQLDRFIGRVEGNQCLIPKQGCLTYLVSDVEITQNTWRSLDRGLDVQTHAQIWGSDHGKLQFEKQTSFAHELPIAQQLIA